MPLFVPVAPGTDTSIPTGPQLSAKYTLVGPDGTRCVFNDAADKDYVGALTEITGLDSPEVREATEDLVQMDGGIHGDFFYGRRPIIASGIILNPSSVDNRNRRMTKLMRASGALRKDATLSWVLDGGYEQQVRVRRQQPLRITGAWQKEFQCSLVAADPRIYSSEFKTDQVALTAGTGQMFPENKGNTLTYPQFVINGPGSLPTIWNFTSGHSIAMDQNLLAGEYLVVDTVSRTVMLNNVTNRYSSVIFEDTTWFGLEPGINDIRLTMGLSSTASGLTVQWRDAWL